MIPGMCDTMAIVSSINPNKEQNMKCSHQSWENCPCSRVAATKSRLEGEIENLEEHLVTQESLGYMPELVATTKREIESLQCRLESL